MYRFTLTHRSDGRTTTWDNLTLPEAYRMYKVFNRAMHWTTNLTIETDGTRGHVRRITRS